MTRRKRPATPPRLAVVHSRVVRMALASSLLLAAGCAHSPCPPFRAAWYLDKAEHANPTIYLALLNEGASPLPLERIVLNPTEPDGSGNVVFASAAAQPDGLAPGRVLLLALDDKLGRCYLPVTVQLQCAQARSRTQPVSGLLPNYLHEQWIASCGEGALDRYEAGSTAVER